MRVLKLHPAPLAEVHYLNAGKRGRTEACRLPLLHAQADRLPRGVEALLLTADLQGVAPSRDAGGASQLLGVVLAEALRELAAEEKIPPPDSIGVLLAGDYYSAPDANERGATGDVLAVWQAFQSMCQWVCGVQGNHDRLSRRPPGDLLDGRIVERGDCSIGGVSFIAGNPAKFGRRELQEQTCLINLVSAQMPDLLILHEGPPGDGPDQGGRDFVADALDERFTGLLVCGHKHWHTPLACAGRYQIANVDARAMLVTV